MLGKGRDRYLYHSLLREISVRTRLGPVLAVRIPAVAVLVRVAAVVTLVVQVVAVPVCACS